MVETGSENSKYRKIFKPKEEDNYWVFIGRKSEKYDNSNEFIICQKHYF